MVDGEKIMDDQLKTSLKVVAILIICMGVAFWCGHNIAKIAMLNYWLPGAEIHGSVVIYSDRVLLPEDVQVIRPNQEQVYTSWGTYELTTVTGEIYFIENSFPDIELIPTEGHEYVEDPPGSGKYYLREKVGE